MFNLEDKLIPSPDRHTPRRDALAAGLVLLLALPLMGGWFMRTGGALYEVVQLRQELTRHQPQDAQSEQIREDLSAAEQSLQQQVRDLTSRTFSPLLLAAMGFALAMRCGAVDLSVWVTGGIGALLGASFLRMPWSPLHTTAWAPLLALPVAAAAGAVIGLANGLLVARHRWPTPLASLAVAGALWLALRLGHCPDSLPVAESAFDNVSQASGLPLWMIRMLVAGLVTGLILIVLLAFGGEPRRLPAARAVYLALGASGALAGLAGALRLLDTSTAFRPPLVGDLRIPAAALLAGAGVLAGRGRTLLACLFVPLGVILASEWMLHVYDWQMGGYHVQVAILIAMTLGTHKALSVAVGAVGKRRPIAWAGLSACAVGMLLATASAGDRSHRACLSFLFAGGLLWASGLAAAFWSRPQKQPEARCP
jgi:ribose/xylose/arabinose/galactoside ABC-type transport system permease subunit